MFAKMKLVILHHHTNHTGTCCWLYVHYDVGWLLSCVFVVCCDFSWLSASLHIKIFSDEVFRQICISEHCQWCMIRAISRFLFMNVVQWFVSVLCQCLVMTLYVAGVLMSVDIALSIGNVVLDEPCAGCMAQVSNLVSLNPLSFTCWFWHYIYVYTRNVYCVNYLCLLNFPICFLFMNFFSYLTYLVCSRISPPVSTLDVVLRD